MRGFWNHFKNLSRHTKHWLGILGVLALSVTSMTMHYDAGLMRSSVLSTPEHAPFDGTVMPIYESPDWTNLTTDEYYASYSEIPASKFQATHEYRNDWFTFPSEDLVWGNAEHNRIRNSKITYSVPYAGHYTFDDCGEHCGSHPAIDWKAPTGTPVHAIANGVITKAGTSSGFGYVVVIEHQGVPHPDNPSLSTTLYTSYSHLSEFNVAEGDIVSKGEVIGAVGSTGTSTTPHLHLSGEYSNAPFMPYWPFTTAEASAAGYDFFSAVNAGVGRDNVYAYTFNVMEWIQDNTDGAPVYTDEAPVEEEPEVIEPEPEEEEEITSPELEEEPEGEPEPELADNPVIDFSTLDLDGPEFMVVGTEKEMTLRLLTEQGDVVRDPQFEGTLEITLSDDSLGTLSDSYVSSDDFDSRGEYDFELYAERTGELTIRFELHDRSFASGTIRLITEIGAMADLAVVTDGSFVPHKAEVFQVQAVDMHGNPTPSFRGSGPVELSLVQGSGVLSETSLADNDFSMGIAEVEFTADSDDPVIIKAVYGKDEYESNIMRAELFTDIDESYDYYTAVSYFFNKGTIQGYQDGSFQPERTVSRVEALKLIQHGMDQDTISGVDLPFPDLEAGAWYEDFLGTAYDAGVVQGYTDGLMRPHNGVTRSEFSKMMIASLGISVDPVVIDKPFDDVDILAWYAPILNYVHEFNLFPGSSREIHPDQAMTRGEVAEMLYRLTAVVQNDEDEPYSPLLRVD